MTKKSLADSNSIAQNAEKEKLSAALLVANNELVFQNNEKEKRAAELLLANKELAFQNDEKEKRAVELLIANKELAFQNDEKEKRAVELQIANKELVFQNDEKEKRALELIIINKQLFSQKQQLEDFCNVISHNLRAPLVNISMLVDFITESDDPGELEEFKEKLGVSTNNLNEIFNELIESLQVKQDTETVSERLIFGDYLQKACNGLQGQISKSRAVIEINFNEAKELIYPSKYLISIFHNLISNSLKYQFPGRAPIIKVETKKMKGSVVLSIQDNGLGIDLIRHKENIFKIRKVFHLHPDAKGFGLFITKSQVEAMGGQIWVESTVNEGSIFFIEFKNQN